MFIFYFFFLFSSFLNIHFNRKILKLEFSYYLFINHFEMPLHKLRKFNTIHIFLDSINTSFFPCSFSRFSSMYLLFFYILLFFCAKFSTLSWKQLIFQRSFSCTIPILLFVAHFRQNHLKMH